MALFHVHVHVISKGTTEGGSAGFAAYMRREAQDEAQQLARYMRREGWSNDDVVAKGYDSMPHWIDSASHFFEMADIWERTRATTARCFEMALPRELSAPARLALAADIRAAYFNHFPSVWAVHNPIDPQGQEHPHMHVMLSERRQLDGIERSPQVYFRQAAAPGQDLATHGVRKDRSWQGPARLRELRAGIATLTNAALERAGLAVAVSHQSHRANGFDREAALYRRHDTAEKKAEVAARREVLHRDVHPWENELNRAAWQEYKQRERLHDLSRQAVLEHVRDRFWCHDPSPARQAEREASLQRARERVSARPAPAPSLDLAHARHRTPHGARLWDMADRPDGGAHVHLAHDGQEHRR